MTYLLDANVFMSASNLHYGLDFCPAFWEWLIESNDAARVFSIEKVEGLHRRAHLEVGPAIDFGVHGAIKSHYKLEDAPDLPLPVDYLVAAAAG